QLGGGANDHLPARQGVELDEAAVRARVERGVGELDEVRDVAVRHGLVQAPLRVRAACAEHEHGDERARHGSNRAHAWKSTSAPSPKSKSSIPSSELSVSSKRAVPNEQSFASTVRCAHENS